MKNKIQKIEFVEIYDMTTEGNGVGKLSDGRAVFVPRCAVGDVAEVLVIKEKKSFSIGKALSYKTKSPLRAGPDCPQYVRCGGCSLRHITYESELAAKRKFVKDCVERIGGLNLPVAEVVSAGSERYRNKAQYPLFDAGGYTGFGFYARRSHSVVQHEDCIIQPEYFAKIARRLCQILDKKGVIPYNEKNGNGVARHIVLRENKSGEIMCTLVVNAKKLKKAREIAEKLVKEFPQIVSFCISPNIKQTNVIMGETAYTVYGQDRLEDELCGKRFKLSPLSFYQVNRKAAELLYEKAKELAALCDGQTLLDLYCGTGTIGISISGEKNNLCGVETIEDAVRDARQNATLNGRNKEKTAFFAADAGEGIRLCKERFDGVDVIVVDPPRKGLDGKVIDEITKSEAERVVYISCNPATMARDLKLFAERSFTCGEVYPYNLFPRTQHVETVVLMSRNVVCKKDKSE